MVIIVEKEIQSEFGAVFIMHPCQQLQIELENTLENGKTYRITVGNVAKEIITMVEALEYDAAIKSDPTKVLVFLKDTDEEIEEKQKIFIDRVSDYYNGYFRTSFQYTHQLQNRVEESFWKWFISRAQVGKNLTNVDHFIRTIKEDILTPEIRLYYQTTERFVEITVCYNNRQFIQHIESADLQLNFWMNVNRVRRNVNNFLEGK